MNFKNIIVGYSRLRKTKGENIPGMPCLSAAIKSLCFGLSLKPEEDHSTSGIVDVAYGVYITRGIKEHRVGTYRFYKKGSLLDWLDDALDFLAGAHPQRVKRTFLGQLPGHRGDMENIHSVTGLFEDLCRILREYERVGAISSSSHPRLLGDSPLRTERAIFTALSSSINKAELSSTQ